MAAGHASCHYPSGALASSDRACDPTANESMCCGDGQICWSNGLCEGDLGNGLVAYFRASCTDATWQSPACLKQCYQINNATYEYVRPCSSIAYQTTYCCDPEDLGYKCCNDTTGQFSLPVPQPQRITYATPVPPNPISSSVSTITSATSSSSTSAFMDDTSTSYAPTLSPSNTSVPALAPSPTSLSTGALVGLVLSLLALTAFISAFLLLWSRNRKMRARNSRLLEQQKLNAELRNMAWRSPMSTDSHSSHLLPNRLQGYHFLNSNQQAPEQPIDHIRPPSTAISSLGSIMHGSRADGTWKAMDMDGRRYQIREVDEGYGDTEREMELERRRGSCILEAEEEYATSITDVQGVGGGTNRTATTAEANPAAGLAVTRQGMYEVHPGTLVRYPTISSRAGSERSRADAQARRAGTGSINPRFDPSTGLI